MIPKGEAESDGKHFRGNFRAVEGKLEAQAANEKSSVDALAQSAEEAADDEEAQTGEATAKMEQSPYCSRQ